MRLVWLMAIPLLVACSPLPPVPSLPGTARQDAGRIVELRSGRVLSAGELVGALTEAPRVLVGERHDNPDHHALQAWLLAAADRRGAAPSLLLEMLVPSQQARASDVQQAIAAGTPPPDLETALAWEQGWPWPLYGELVTQAMRREQPVLAANLDPDEIKRIYRARPALPQGAATESAVRDALLAQIRESHCGLLPESQLPAMLAVQQQRDRRMAERLLAAPTPAWLFAGAFHVRKDLGVPLHLADLGAQGPVRVLMLAEAGESVTATQADYVWYTPPRPAEDHCAALRGSHGTRGDR
ncbi:iron(III) ABC transporter [Stutzerimonas urumqiensis]|uniref:ChaN family lipoprotein n=1 Tax=Stutzerimonas urumqiensis TaxID=638269 RepID=UPI003BAAA95F